MNPERTGESNENDHRKRDGQCLRQTGLHHPLPEHTLFVITTDGMENASRRYDSEKVKKMIERQKKKYGWEFLFLGANIDAVETARHFGIGADRAVNYHSDHEGTQLNYEVLSEAVSAVRCSVPLGTNWKKRIDEDFNSRKDGRKQ